MVSSHLLMFGIVFVACDMSCIRFLCWVEVGGGGLKASLVLGDQYGGRGHA
jgi:hypothetical protein